MNVLLVDDNKTFMAAVNHFIDLVPGVNVVGQASNGHEALAKAADLDPDLVLLDIAMPDMTGFEVARQMQSWPKPPRIVFLSMHENAAYRTAASDLHPAGYVGKSDFVVELFPIIQSLVNDEQFRTWFPGSPSHSPPPTD